MCTSAPRVYVSEHLAGRLTSKQITRLRACSRQLRRACAEHCIMAAEPLQNLTEQSARVGSWLLSVAEDPKPEEYTWTKGIGKGTGKKFECRLVSEDSEQYCLGVFKRKGKEPAATKDFNAAVEKFKKGSVEGEQNISGSEG